MRISDWSSDVCSSDLNYVEDARADKYPELASLIRNALAYNRDFIAPTLLRRKPEGVEVAALERLDRELAALAPDAAAEDIQTIVYKIGRASCRERVCQYV